MNIGNLTIESFLWRATQLFPDKEVVARTRDGQMRYTYRELGKRIRALASALSELGVEPGDRVGTFGWNHHRHLEAYFAVPLMGAQLHTINVQLPDERIEFIVNDAADNVLLVDPGTPLETIERLYGRFDDLDHIVVMDEEVPETSLDEIAAHDALIDAGDSTFDWPDLDEEQPAGMCYTSGTTAAPKASSTLTR